MDWTRWSRIWSTKSTTTTSRKPPQRRRKCLRLQADSRLKQTEKTFNYLLIFKNCTYSRKIMDWYWTRSSIQSGVPTGKKNKYASSARRITSRTRWSDWILKIKRLSSVRIWVLSIKVWWCMEEQDGMIRQDKKFFISELFNVIQDAISLILHCRTMCKFWTVTSSAFVILDVQSVYNTITNSGLIPGGQKLSKKQTVFFTAVNPREKEHKDPYKIDLTAPRLAKYKQKKVEETSRHGVLGRPKTCSTERIEVLSNKIESNHLLRHTPSLRNHIRESICVTSSSSKDFL